MNLKSLLYKNTNHNIYRYHKGDFHSMKKSIIDFQNAFLSSYPYDKSIEQNWLSFKDVCNHASSAEVRTFLKKQDILSKHTPWLNKSKMKESKCLRDTTKRLNQAWKSYQRLRNRIPKEIE